MSSEHSTVALKGHQWILVLIIAAVSGALGGLFAGGFQLNIDDDSVIYRNPPSDTVEYPRQDSD